MAILKIKISIGVDRALIWKKESYLNIKIGATLSSLLLGILLIYIFA